MKMETRRIYRVFLPGQVGRCRIAIAAHLTDDSAS